METETAVHAAPRPQPTKVQQVGLFLGPALFLLLLVLPAPPGMSAMAFRTTALTLWVAVWWVTEAIPIPAASLLPMLVLPLLGVLPLAKACEPYANPVIFMFLGGFILALAIERWGLHRRMALAIIAVIGTSPARLVLGFMVATGILSMWINNTSAVMMMLPTALAVAAHVEALAGGEAPDPSLGTALMLGIAYAASWGGMATLVGTAPNIMLAGAARALLGREIGFLNWLAIGLPLATLGILLTWVYLARFHFRLGTTPMPGAAGLIREERASLGPMSPAERRVAVVMGCVAFAWVVQPWLLKPLVPGLGDAGIAIAGAIALFVLPSGDPERPPLMDWACAATLPWGVLLLFGGGLALADAFLASGLSAWLGGALGGLQGLPTFVVLAGVVALVCALTEVTSNTATATMMMPVMAALGPATGVDPLALMIAAAVASSCAFMLPVATPPNAIVFATGRVAIGQMVRAGVWLNLGAMVLVVLVVHGVVPWVWPRP